MGESLSQVSPSREHGLHGTARHSTARTFSAAAAAVSAVSGAAGAAAAAAVAAAAVCVARGCCGCGCGGGGAAAVRGAFTPRGHSRTRRVRVINYQTAERTHATCATRDVLLAVVRASIVLSIPDFICHFMVALIIYFFYARLPTARRKFDGVARNAPPVCQTETGRSAVVRRKRDARTVSLLRACAITRTRDPCSRRTVARARVTILVFLWLYFRLLVASFDRGGDGGDRRCPTLLDRLVLLRPLRRSRPRRRHIRRCARR